MTVCTEVVNQLQVVALSIWVPLVCFAMSTLGVALFFEFSRGAGKFRGFPAGLAKTGEKEVECLTQVFEGCPSGCAVELGRLLGVLLRGHSMSFR